MKTREDNISNKHLKEYKLQLLESYYSNVFLLWINKCSILSFRNKILSMSCCLQGH